ncbi:MAG: DEAD/DEAH box helicase [Thermofilaceae archaeon]
MQKVLDEIRRKYPVDIEESNNLIKVLPRGYIKEWHTIHSILKEYGAQWSSADRAWVLTPLREVSPEEVKPRFIESTERTFTIEGVVPGNAWMELLKFADVVSKEQERVLVKDKPVVKTKATLAISEEKIKRSTLGTEDIVRALRNFGDVPEALIYTVQRIVQDRDTVVLTVSNDRIVLEPRRFLGQVYEEMKEKGWVEYRDKKITVVPRYFWDVVNHLKARGFYTKNETGIEYSIPLGFKVEVKNFTLRDYQRAALEKWIQNNYQGIIAIPTGGGKSIVDLFAIAHLSERTLILVLTREIGEQFKRLIVENTNIPPSMVGMFHSREKSIREITISTYASAYRHPELLRNFSFIIYTDCHRVSFDKLWLTAREAPAAKRLGETGTPFRKDQDKIFPLLGGLVYSISYEELARRGYLARYEIERVYVDLYPDEREKYEEARRLYRSLSCHGDFEDVLACAKGEHRGEDCNGGSGPCKRCQEALKHLKEAHRVASTCRAKVELAKRLMQRLSGKTIFFCQYRDQAEEVSRVLGIPYLTSAMSDSERRRVFEAFRTGAVKAVVATPLIDEGVDVPDAEVGVILSGLGGSKRQFHQRLGRILRYFPGKKAKLIHVVASDTVEEYWAEEREQPVDA